MPVTYAFHKASGVSIRCECLSLKEIKMTTLAKVAGLVSSHSTFNCNGSLFAKIVGPFYAVYSYGEHFPVAIRQRTNDDPWLVNEDKYSATTSRHQSKVLGGILQSGRGHIKCSTQNLQNLLAGGV